eukprot:10113115-Karenia_brevis.AAC.1
MIVQQPGAHSLMGYFAFLKAVSDCSIPRRPYTTGIYRRDPVETILKTLMQNDQGRVVTAVARANHWMGGVLQKYVAQVTSMMHQQISEHSGFDGVIHDFGSSCGIISFTARCPDCNGCSTVLAQRYHTCICVIHTQPTSTALGQDTPNQRPSKLLLLGQESQEVSDELSKCITWDASGRRQRHKFVTPEDTDIKHPKINKGT